MVVENCGMCWQERSGLQPFDERKMEHQVCLGCKKQITAVKGFLRFCGFTLEVAESEKSLQEPATNGPAEKKK